MKGWKEILEANYNKELTNMLINYKSDIVSKAIIAKKLAKKYNKDQQEALDVLNDAPIHSTKDKDLSGIAKDIINKLEETVK